MNLVKGNRAKRGGSARLLGTDRSERSNVLPRFGIFVRLGFVGDFFSLDHISHKLFDEQLYHTYVLHRGLK